MPITVLQIRENGQITLPTSIRRLSNLKAGDLLEINVDDNGTICLTPKVAIDRSQAYFWTKRWQEGERKADEDIKSGHVEKFDDIDSALKFLETPHKKR